MRRILFAAALCAFLISCAPTPKAHAQTYTETVLHSFCAETGCPDGEQPVVGLMQASDGNFYGVTSNEAVYSGSGTCTVCGTVFRITPAGDFTTIYTFCSLTNCADGAIPMGGLIEGSDGNLYGTTVDGGTGAGGDGTVFKLTFGGVLTTLANFAFYSGPALPASALVEGTDGNFYGTTAEGGDTTQNCEGCGTVFVANSSGANQIYSFCSVGADQCSDGARPTAKLVQGTDGAFYGTTPDTPGLGSATIFKITSAGSLDTLAYPASNGLAISGLVEDANGQFYGVDGGNFFEVSSTGSLNNLSSDVNSSSDPFLASDGNFYDTTLGISYGSLLRLTPAGIVKPVYNFCSQTACADGNYPEAGVIQGSDGAFYGVTANGGAYKEGTIYKVAATPALAGPVQVSLSESSITLGQSVKLSWSVSNAFSLTMQQCYAHLPPGVVGAGGWSGLQTGTMSNGIFSGSATITPTAAGVFSYALTCGGVESGLTSLEVGGAKFVTGTALASNSPVTLGSDVILTATVTSQQSATPLTGSVTFSVNGISLGSVQLANGTASLYVPAINIPTTTYPVTASYSGDTNYAISAGATSVVVQGYPTAAALVFSPARVTQGQPVTFTATVSRTGMTGTASGTVTFLYEGVSIGTAKLNGGNAALTFPTSGLPTGNYAVTAAYSGDPLDQPATSPAATVTILAPTTTTLELSPDPVPANQGLNFSVQVKQTNGQAVPTGIVTFSVDGFTLGTQTLDGTGKAGLTASTLGVPAGGYTATVAYGGDGTNAASSASVPFTLQ